MATKGDKKGVVIHTVEMHTGGEPLRIIQSGMQHSQYVGPLSYSRVGSTVSTWDRYHTVG